MYERYIKEKVVEAMADTPVVIVAGPRQCGKTTLVKTLQGPGFEYTTLDNLVQFETAKSDPIGFIRSLTAQQIIIDEIQRVPELFLCIKEAVDENRIPGKYLLTGSANAMMLPKISDSLAGRMEVITLLPFAECELNSTTSTFLNKILSGKPPTSKQTKIKELLIPKILNGGFPEPLTRSSHRRRSAWYIQYINSLVQKDMRDLSGIENLEIMPRFIQMLCHQVGQLTNFTSLAGKLGLSRQSITRYFTLLEQLFIFERLPAWHRNHSKRLVKTSKIHIVDTGLMAATKQLTLEKLNKDPTELGSLLESYVLCELKRLATWYDHPLHFYHYRDKDKIEVDIVIETSPGEVIGIEVKSTSTIRQSDFRGLEQLKSLAKDDFLIGIILYDGDRTTQHSDKLFSVPMAAIWE